MSEEEIAKAFSIAKEALALISTFRTPPTPEVYEVWYRYVEGANKPIRDQLNYATKVAKEVSVTQLHQLRDQFLGQSDDTDNNVSQKLASELEGLQSLITTQQKANVEFSGSIASANGWLTDETSTPEDLKSCLGGIIQSNTKMQLQIAEMDSKLKLSSAQVECLRNTLAEVHESIRIDPLTGIGNRRVFDETIMLANGPRTSDTPSFLFLVDMDEFKTINDTHGHKTGDDVLRFVGNALTNLVNGATVTRYGGDEFAIFAKVEPDQAKQLAEYICSYFHVNDLTVKCTGEPLGKLTISLGAAHLRADDDSESWFERADKLLYSAKSGSKNRAMVERTNFR